MTFRSDDKEMMVMRDAVAIYQSMANKPMADMLIRGEAIDVHTLGTAISDRVFVLRTFIEGADYCDRARERWIWSIGRDRQTGIIYAATDCRFHADPRYTCLWLR